ncbi:TRAP transporter small permease [Roseomonas sp. AR75]|uniref:TRAP transporter small permease n=1 Tax=Roseomonas sp. AR75 TaxID=2562311 RepID=UPI001981A4A1|nr:TRAP transporter small permease subunit [Roseomonas sp. AR75]
MALGAGDGLPPPRPSPAGAGEGVGKAIDGALRVVAVLLLLSLLLAVMTGVVSRQLGDPVSWSDEAAQYLLVWTGFAGWMIGARRRDHIRIGAFVDLLPGGARRAAEAAIQLLCAAFALALLWWGWPLIERNWDVEWVSLPLPAGLLYVPVPFAAALLAGQAMLDCANALRAPR